MKILYSCPLDPVKLVAPGQHVASVFLELSRAGHSMKLIHQGTELPGVEAESQIALNLDRRNWLGRLGTDARYAVGLLGLIKRSRFESVYHRMEKWSILPLFVFKYLKIFTVLEINADNRAELASVNANWFLRILYPLSEYLQVHLSDQIVVVSEGIGKNLARNIKRVESKIVVVENGADTGIYYPRDRLESCNFLGLDPERRYVVFSGSFQKWQGLDTLVDSAVHVQKVLPDVSFVLVGDGRMRSAIERRIGEKNLASKFILTGWQNPNQVAKYLAASSVCVAPYSPLAALDPTELENGYTSALMKCSPLKIYTYMAMGKPIVASAFLDGGQRLAEWGAGMAFEPGSDEALADALTRVLNNKTLARDLGQNALSRVTDHHTWAAVAKKIDRQCFSDKH